MTIVLLPTRGRFHASEQVTIEIRNAEEDRADQSARIARPQLRISHLGDIIRDVDYPMAEPTASTLVSVGALPAGGYGVELFDGEELIARTAVDVCADHSASPLMLYGFVTDYSPNRDPQGVIDHARRLHLTHVQFYDWAYRHADLLGGGEDYRDALDQPISLATVRRLVEALAGAGIESLGYAAVYGVGNDEWSQWHTAALLRPDGTPYSLGDFLQLVDPADPKWLQHFTDQLVAATSDIGFSGFHLDQYGYPKLAVTPDDAIVDLAASFVTVIHQVRGALRTSTLIFNNVNDFPTHRTVTAPQDATYIEVWPPHDDLGDLADLVTRTPTPAGRPTVVAAYQHVYDMVPADEPSAADHATALTMATLFSHGATQLLCGEADRILIDPYYVRNHPAAPSTRQMLTRWYDFAVEHRELLFDAAARADLTGSWAGSYNDDCDVTYETQQTSWRPTAGTVWRRITATPQPGMMVMHLINLLDQHDTLWDAPRQPNATRPLGRLRLRRVGADQPAVRVADPDTTPSLTPLASTDDPASDWTTFTLPPLRTWQLLLIDLTPTARTHAASPRAV